jgi:hypothetical protein
MWMGRGLRVSFVPLKAEVEARSMYHRIQYQGQKYGAPKTRHEAAYLLLFFDKMIEVDIKAYLCYQRRPKIVTQKERIGGDISA